MTALPDFKQSAPASAVTLGRLSYMMPITPNGTRTRWMASPFGRSQSATVAPVGSGSATTSSMLRAIASTRFSSSCNRSRSAPPNFASACRRHITLVGGKNLPRRARTAARAADQAIFFRSVFAKANTAAAFTAALLSPSMSSPIWVQVGVHCVACSDSASTGERLVTDEDEVVPVDVSCRPRKPRIPSISEDFRPLIFTASRSGRQYPPRNLRARRLARCSQCHLARIAHAYRRRPPAKAFPLQQCAEHRVDGDRASRAQRSRDPLFASRDRRSRRHKPGATGSRLDPPNRVGLMP